MKKNTLFSKKNFLTLFSVLSVLLIFFLACLGTLFVLHRTSVVRLPFFDRDEPETIRNTQVMFPVYSTETISANFVPSGIAHYEQLAKEVPFAESFYAKVKVTDWKNESPSVSIYEIWRFGERYRINRYNEQEEVDYMAACDGKRVRTVDFSALSISYHDLNEKYTFERMDPWPDFDVLFQGDYEIFEYSEDQDICFAVCEYADRQLIDETKISKQNGFLLSYRVIEKGKTVLTMETLTVDMSFQFDDQMFAIN